MKEIAYLCLETRPELYSDKPRKYMVRELEYGLYTKKEAELISEFLRNNFHKIIFRAVDNFHTN